jgi:DNA-binding Lrp family transcriptional regulator
MAEKQGKVGRPRKEIHDKETLNKIVEYGAQGLTIGQIAKCLGISRASLDRRRAEYEEIEEAIKKGEALGVSKIAQALMNNAIHENNVTAQIFYLKNRSENWADRQEVNHNLDLGGILTDARQRIIEGTSERPSVTHERTEALEDKSSEALDLPLRAYERARDTEK